MVNNPSELSISVQEDTDSRDVVGVNKENVIESLGVLDNVSLTSDNKIKHIGPMERAEQLTTQLDLMSEEVPVVCNGTHNIPSVKNIPNINNCDDGDLLEFDLTDKCNKSESSSDKGAQDSISEEIINNKFVDIEFDSNLNSDDKTVVHDTRQGKGKDLQDNQFSGVPSTNSSNNTESSSLLCNNLNSNPFVNIIDVELNSSNEEYTILDFTSKQKSEAGQLCNTIQETLDATITEETEHISGNHESNNFETNLNSNSENNVDIPNLDEVNISEQKYDQPKESNVVDSETLKPSQDLKDKIGNSIKSMFDNNEHLNLNLLEKQNIANLQTNTLKKVNNLFSSFKSYNFPNFRNIDEAIKNSPDAKQDLQHVIDQSNNSKSFPVSEQATSMLFSPLNKEETLNVHSSENPTQSEDDGKHAIEKTLESENLDNQRKFVTDPKQPALSSYVLNSDLIHTVKNAANKMQESNSHSVRPNTLDTAGSQAQKSISLDSSPVRQNRFHDVQDELYLLKETNIRLLAEISKLEEEKNRVRKEFRTYREEADLFKSSMKDQLLQHETWKEQNRALHETELRVLTQARHDMEVKMEKLKKDFEYANKEKEASVMRYVTKESELINARKEKESVEKKYKELAKEKDIVLGKLKVLSTDKARLTQMFDDKCTEYNILQRSLDKVTDEVTGKDIKLKWVQSKLDKEVECSRSLSEKLASVEIQQAVQVDEQNRLKYSEDSQRLLLQEIDVLKKKVHGLTEENNTLSLKVQRLEKERLESDETMSKCKTQVTSQNETISQLRNELANMEDLKNQLHVQHERVLAKHSEVELVQKSNTELTQDMATCRSREAELLQFTEKLTAKNVRLQSEFSALEAKAENLEKDVAPLNARISQLEGELREVESQLDAERTCKEGDNKALARVVAERTKQLEAASKEIEELKSENQILKRKHTTTVRELNKELVLLKKKAESSLTNGDVGCDTNTIGYGSRASSCQSLNEAHSPTSASVASTLSSTLQLEPDRNVIIERLVELQRSHARVIEKAEFLEEHNAQLVSELQKKTRILQNYILREQSGALTSRTMDVNKAEVSKHGGIMSSLYNSRPVDGGMTLELSLEINRKLQAVLEDTILKNITLKENIDTLGEHIDKISKKS